MARVSVQPGRISTVLLERGRDVGGTVVEGGPAEGLDIGLLAERL